MGFNFLTGMMDDERQPVKSSFDQGLQDKLMAGTPPLRVPTAEDMARGSPLRRLLGTLGDAFAAQAGITPEYETRVKQARIADAMEGFENDPDSAIKRIMGI